MFLVGLTGGMGSGKSTVAVLLAEHGAVVVDADAISREVVVPGGVAYQPIIDRFGSGVLAADGSLDRAALAELVFKDEEARRALEAITHPAIGRVMLGRIAENADSDRMVVLDIPLLREKNRMGAQSVVVVDCPEAIAIERLVQFRGFTEDDARRRIAAQIGREERLALADVVISNAGTVDDLRGEVDRAWGWLEARRTARE